MKKTLLLTLTIVMLGGCIAYNPGSNNTLLIAHDRRNPTTIASDHALKSRIIAKLLASPEIAAYSHTNINVFNNIVLVTGEAMNQGAVDRVVNTVNTTPNIRRVDSDIFIGPKSTIFNRTNDTVITGKVKTALLTLRLPNFDPSLIKVITERSNVYLMGIVTQQEADAITKLTSKVSGVRSVTKAFDVVGVNY